MNILYIEDEPSEAGLVKMYFNTTSHHLTVANSIQEARSAFSSDNQLDLILVDVLLGQERAGFGLVREFREQGYTKPVVAVTGLSTSTDMEECRKAGFDYVLNKPFAIDQLAEVINRYAA